MRRHSQQGYSDDDVFDPPTATSLEFQFDSPVRNASMGRGNVGASGSGYGGSYNRPAPIQMNNRAQSGSNISDASCQPPNSFVVDSPSYGASMGRGNMAANRAAWRDVINLWKEPVPYQMNSRYPNEGASDSSCEPPMYFQVQSPPNQGASMGRGNMGGTGSSYGSGYGPSPVRVNSRNQNRAGNCDPNAFNVPSSSFQSFNQPSSMGGGYGPSSFQSNNGLRSDSDDQAFNSPSFQQPSSPMFNFDSPQNQRGATGGSNLVTNDVSSNPNQYQTIENPYNQNQNQNQWTNARLPELQQELANLQYEYEAAARASAGPNVLAGMEDRIRKIFAEISRNSRM